MRVICGGSMYVTNLWVLTFTTNDGTEGALVCESEEQAKRFVEVDQCARWDIRPSSAGIHINLGEDIE